MKIRTIFICDVCGYESDDPLVILDCEEIGYPEQLFNVGDRISAFLDIAGTIDDVRIVRSANATDNWHMVQYFIAWDGNDIENRWLTAKSFKQLAA